ncbi:sensor histidine kinase [Ramlibacter sp.]|uniref:sensor histidine kinase n=1 Tax=Ramlibacter sp. TaxID=1917967 RepID=UPI00183DFCDC|nr:sensor histidine kinase [Ramlibacter sp.]MBA2672765.1 sensor histidine kinase [Ramlibacter sp.]
MRLAEFLRTHADDILRAWDEFASTVPHEGRPLDHAALRDHAAEILRVIALDLDQPQTATQQYRKSRGEEGRETSDTPAETHADVRVAHGFSVDAMMREYRALRASVVRLWTESGLIEFDGNGMEQLTRFNEAIDQAITESITRCSELMKQTSNIFIGILGHDIRNPLSTIAMSAEYLVRSGKIDEKAAAPIKNSVARIGGLIEQVVDFTRAQVQGVMPVQRKPGDLADQLVKVLEETQVRHPERKLLLERSGSFEGDWDEGRMGQLLSNLLGNAISYGARSAPITLKMWAGKDDVSFSVHNRGTPIPPGDLARVFEPLARGSLADAGAERREPSGLGLGLYICREIVKAHDGDLTVASTQQDGTTFTVCMPRLAKTAPP